ncbi:hypothetical protein [Borrelia hispanica]|uniref:hypothetical protein n=1 Tax=Borrelia hispanica TaxID=40835 RepID=UPI0004633E48|nr:hypothetical protein [Borrelia hispanica]
MSRGIFSEFNGSYHGDILRLAKKGLEDLVPYKVINRSDLRDGYFVARKSTARHNVTSSAGDYSNEIGMSGNSVEEITYKMHVFNTLQRIPQRDLIDGEINEDEVKSNLELALIKNAYNSLVFGKPSIKMEGIATLSGRTKLTATQASSLTTGTTLHQKVVEAKLKSEDYKEEFEGVYQLLLPHKFAHLLLDLYSEPQYITVRESLLKDHKILTKIFKGLEHPILYEPDPAIMFVPIMSEISFRRFGGIEGDFIHASMRSAGVVHFNPAEVVEITISS